MSRQKNSTRTSLLLAILFILLGFTAWTHRDLAVLAPTTQETTTRVAQPVNRRHLYFGPPASVAVLPFTCARYPTEERDDSTNTVVVDHDSASEIYSFGLADTLTDRLIRIEELHVTSSESTTFFAWAEDQNVLLAERLRTRNVLDGCVRTNGQELTIAARMYDVRSGQYDWQKEWQGSAQALPLFLDSVMIEVVNILQPGLPADSIEPLVDDPEVWLQLLNVRYLTRQRLAESLVDAETILQEVVETQPTNASAWLGLAKIYLDPSWPPGNGKPGFELARESAETVLQLDQNQAGAYLILSRIARFIDWDFQKARRLAEFALESLGGDAGVLANASSNAFIFGEYERAVQLLEQSIDRNPVVLNKQLKLGLIHEFNRNFEQALITYRQLLVLNPEYPGAYAFRARVHLAQGQADKALEDAEMESNPLWQKYAQILALDALQRRDESNPIILEMENQNGHNAATQIAEIYAMRAEVDMAFEWLERAFVQRDGGLSEVAGNPFFKALHEDPRWSELLDRLGLDR